MKRLVRAFEDRQEQCVKNEACDDESGQGGNKPKALNRSCGISTVNRFWLLGRESLPVLGNHGEKPQLPPIVGAGQALGYERAVELE